MAAPALGDILIRALSGWTRLASPADSTKFLNGNGAYSVPAGSGGSDWTIVKTKASDDTVTNSATFTSDSELVATLVASGRYLFEMIIFYSGTSTAADYKFQFLLSQAVVLTASILGQYNILGLTLSPQAPSASIGNSTTVWPLTPTQCGTDGSSTVLGFFVRGILIAPAAGGTMTYQFAQSTQTAANSVKTLIGSTLRLQHFA